MSNLNRLCYKKGGSALAYKKGGNALIYKAAAKGDWCQIAFAWGSNGNDLDICAYWVNAASLKMGYGYNTSKSEQTSGNFHILYSGDIRQTSTSEWVKVKMIPWSGAQQFKVHLNFYGYDSEDYPASVCKVIATQMNGPTIILSNVTCGTSNGSKATTSDNGVLVSFDASGVLTSLTTF